MRAVYSMIFVKPIQCIGMLRLSTSASESATNATSNVDVFVLLLMITTISLLLKLLV